ncbi:MAG: type II toxin-antitoxin system HicA family toxin [Anaerolineales bacterium]|nr:type II toxin-antitoxin system HicA family toxin [Anaerolineales bacterium]
MSKLPIADFKTMDKLLRQLGFIAVRQKGSHVFYRHADGRTTTLPNHGGRDISRPLIQEILREISVTPDEYINLLNDL